MDGANDRQHIDQVVDALEIGVGSAVDRDTLAAVVEADFGRYSSTARITAFVPIFVERDVRARLQKHRNARKRPIPPKVSPRS